MCAYDACMSHEYHYVWTAITIIPPHLDGRTHRRDASEVTKQQGQRTPPQFVPNLRSKCPPIGISEYELSKLYPTEVEGMIPTIEEIEAKLGELQQEDGKDE